MKILRAILWIAGGIFLVFIPIELFYFSRPDSFLSIPFFIFVMAPSVILLTAAFGLKRSSQRMYTHVMVFSMCLITTIFFGGGHLSMVGIKQATTIVTDENKYITILNDWKEAAPEIVSHFPEEVPHDAQDVNFYYIPAFLQGDAQIQLWFKTSPEKIERYYDEFSKIETMIYRDDFLVRYYLGNRESCDVIDFDDSYIGMSLDTDPNSLSEHMKQHGVVINKDKSEIIFWARW